MNENPPLSPPRRSSFRWATLTLLASVLATSGMAQGVGSPTTPGAAAPAIPAPLTGALRPVERTFLERAAELSRRQIRFAQLGVSQATSSDVRTYAQQIASDNRQISDSVEGLGRRKAAWPGNGIEPAAPDGFQRLAQTTGTDFDREFVRMAGELHTTALTLFEEVLADAKDPDVRDLIGTYLPVLRDHLNRGTELQKTYN